MTGPPQRVFRKTRPGAPASYFQREGEGLQWLRQAEGGAAVVPVHSIEPDSLLLTRLVPAPPDASAARAFGAALARTHAAGAEHFGQAPPSADNPTGGFIADLPLPFGAWSTFGTFYAQARVQPYLAMLSTRQILEAGAGAVFDTLLDRLCAEDPALIGPVEHPSRIHGDLWSGNVVWSTADAGDVRGWLIDPAAHGGHRETDLAMLSLFGAPHLSSILAGYQSTYPLAAGWQQRQAVHQVHPLLVHYVLFGGSYLDQAVTAARRALTPAP